MSLTVVAPRSPSLLARLSRRTLRHWHTLDWVKAVGDDWPEWIMQLDARDRLFTKQGRSIARWHWCGASVYLKRHYQLPRLAGWLALLWPRGNWSPAAREWANLLAAQKAGLPVARPVAFAEWTHPSGRLQSVLAVDELQDMLALHEAIPLAQSRQLPEAFARWKAGLIGELARLARLLHDSRQYHKDLYLCHFYIHDDLTHAEPPGGWRDRVTMIDFHRLARHPLTGAWWQVKDLGQLLYSSMIEGVTPRDRVRFWRAYRVGQRGAWYSLAARIVLLRARRYLAHNRKRSQKMGRL